MKPTASEPRPTEPQKCAGCGTNLEGLEGEDFVARYADRRLLLAFCDDYCNGLYDGRNKPLAPLPEDAPELKEALDKFRRAIARYATCSPFDLDNAMDATDSTERALVALFGRQREEITKLGDIEAGVRGERDGWEARAEDAEDLVASLESQLERLKAEQPQLTELVGEMAKQASLGHKRFCVGVHEHEGGELEYEWIDWADALARILEDNTRDLEYWVRRVQAAESQLERLKAEQLTAEEAQSVLNDVADLWSMDSAIEKLRSRSQSEQPTEELKE